MARSWWMAAMVAVLAACTGGGTPPTDAAILDASSDIAACLPSNDVRPRSNPIEYVGLQIQRPVNALADFLAVVDPIFGQAAAAGNFHNSYVLQPGLFLTVTADPRTTAQVIVTLEMQPSQPANAPRRTIMRVPVSFQYGSVFIQTVEAALDRANSLFASSPSDSRPFFLEYNTYSVNGGYFTIHLDWNNGVTTLQLITQDPRTSLAPGMVNHPAFTGDPYETISGTVNFTLDRDEFSFFTNRAYGITSGAAQNFQDFQLEPHNWLRLTVTPDLVNQVVNVAFVVVALDGTRIPFAKAPASYLAGDQFQQNVFRLVDNMLAQEQAQAGSSTPWTSPFYYDDPAGGGVVSVIASGVHGVFNIAYAVASPTHTLQDVSYIPYLTNLDLPSSLPPAHNTCADVGSTDAVHGHFQLKFDASSTVRTSPNLNGPLSGDVYGNVYRASDVTITGPNAGAVAVATFHFPNVDITNPANLMTYDLPTDLPSGQYQILGFMDTNHNADPTNPSPDTYDPVTLPIGGYTLQCVVQPVTVEFALLLPPGQ